MKVVLAGQSRYGEALKTALADAGLQTLGARTADELKSLPGELPVVLLYDAKLNPVITDQKAAGRALFALKPHDLVVFLMDKNEEAAPYVENQVLTMASYLASVKRRVAVLLRSSRASDEKFDDLYREARQKGVTFIRYESADVAEEEGIYTINAFDGKLSVSLETSLCVDCAELLDPELEAMIDFLKIRRYGDGCISGNRWFLTQGATFKRNVRFINTAALGTDVLKIVPSLVSDLCALSEPGQTKTAYVDPKKCAFCYTCYRVCPHSALMPDDEAKAMKVNELLCSACGICVSVCPAAAISFKGEAARDVSSEKTRKLKVFCCENSAYIASKEAFAGMDVAIEPISCGGEVSAALMTQTLKEYDNVLVAVCCDDACKHRDGNKRLIKQVERLKDRLEKLGYDPGRVSCVQTGVTMVNMLKDAAEKALSGGGEK